MMKRSLVLVFFMLSSIVCLTADEFKQEQLRFPRVRAAYREKSRQLARKLAERSFLSLRNRLFIRGFKEEKILEIWLRRNSSEPFTRIWEYSFCRSSGRLGPKRRQGDMQVPEGFYFIDRFNPISTYHLSLGINYPNRSDRLLSDAVDPGGDIFIHGSCVTIGCIPITDDKIKELYILAVEAKDSGQSRIPVHIYPARLTEEKMTELRSRFRAHPDLLQFWQVLKKGYDYFEIHRKPVPVVVGTGGYYIFE